MAGFFLTFEGIEGSGKTTQCTAVAKALLAGGRDVVLAREPGGTGIGEQIRATLLDRKNDAIAPLTELLLYVAARAQLVFEAVRPALEAGKIVVCDRYGDASAAYQGGARGLGIPLVQELNRIATGGLTPHLTVLLDLPASEGLARMRVRSGGRADRLESEPVAFHERVRAAYLELAAAETDRFLVLDSRRPTDELTRTILGAVGERLGG